MKKLALLVAFVTASTLIMPYLALAQEKDPPEDSLPHRLFNRTLGGRQFWGDVEVFHEWHIQKNVFTGHYRLLDGDKYRQAWGSLEECRQALDEIKERKHLPPMSGKAVILVHGLLGNYTFFDKMADDLQKADYFAIPFSYPSGQVKIADASLYLQQVMDSLEGVEEIDIVCHSLGGLVVRDCLAAHPDKRVKRIVMLGVPNKGDNLADIGQGNFIWERIGGPAGQELITGPEGVIASLPVPACEFAVIAGGKGDNKGYNPIIPGDDDGTVAVESTELEGSADFAVVRALHHQLPGNEDVRQMTLSFLQTGKFRAAK